MLEILFVYFLCKKLGAMLRAKNQKPLPYQIMLVVFWIGGEFMAFIVAGIVEAMRTGGAPSEDFNPAIYLLALVGAGCGAGLAFLIAWMLPDNRPVAAYGAVSPAGEMPFAPPDPNNPYAPPQTRN
jgi:hypothetical protein